MSTLEIILRLVAGVLLTAANAFFVAIEFGLTRLRQLPQSEETSKAWEMTEKLEFYLTGCQVGISLTSILLGVVAEPAVTKLLRPLFDWIGLSGSAASTASVILAVFLIQFAHKIWGEQTPTYLGVERPELVGKYLAYPLWIWSKITYPFIIAGDTIAKWTLRLFGVRMTRSWIEKGEDEEGAAEETPHAGSREFRTHLFDILSRARVSQDRRQEIVAAYEIGERPLEQIMIPREQMVLLRANAPFRENLRTMQQHAYTRFPLVGESPDDFRGVIYLPAVIRCYEQLARGELSLQDLASEPVKIEKPITIARFIDVLQSKHQELAMIFERGHAKGLATATDAFESIIGSLEDPLD